MKNRFLEWQQVNIVQLKLTYEDGKLNHFQEAVYGGKIVNYNIEAETKWPTFSNAFSWMKMYEFS